MGAGTGERGERLAGPFPGASCTRLGLWTAGSDEMGIKV